MRGKKGSYYDGGHRVPFFLRWPAGELTGARDIDELTLHVDILPTLIDLCKLQYDTSQKFDGRSLGPLLRSELSQFPDDRVHFLQYRQSTDPPEKWTNAIITRQWRLVYGHELYDIKTDPQQQHDVSDQYPGIVHTLRAAHERWWEEIEPGLAEYCPISIGNTAENPTRLDAMDVMGDVAWHQTHIVLAKKSTGRWMVDVEQPGTYRFYLRRWPAEIDLPIHAAVSPEEAQELIYAGDRGACTIIQPAYALLKLFEIELQHPVQPEEKNSEFTIEVTQAGITPLEAWFIDENGQHQGAYYVYIERL
jgi:hypothetical protein